MSYQTTWPHKKALGKMLPGNREIKLGKAFDLMHGWCWMCRVWNWDTCECFHGFSTNRFTAVRIALTETSSPTGKNE